MGVLVFWDSSSKALVTLETVELEIRQIVGTQLFRLSGRTRRAY